MLLQFSIKNFKTFKETSTLSLIASNYDKDSKEDENVFSFEKFNLRLLKSAVIYGANASGKSKFIEALAFMRNFIINSSKETQKGEPIRVTPFLLNSETENEASEFEIIFLLNEELYRYGFEVNQEKVISEWLFHRPRTKEVELFYRDGGYINTHERKFRKGGTIVKEELVRDNALLLSVAAQFNDETAIKIIEWFKGLKLISRLEEIGYHGFTINKTKDPTQKDKILELLKAADLGIQEIELKKLDIHKLPKGLPQEFRDAILKRVTDDNLELIDDVLTLHKKYNSKKQSIGSVNLSMDKDESSGTRKFFALAGPILDVIENGYTLVVDELDSKLHPNLTEKIVSLFNSKDFNKKNAQLIFNTHNTNLLDHLIFRRDQIWFTEKNKYGEAKLYSLADFKSDEVKKNEAYENNYNKGKYGAVPYLENFNTINESMAKYGKEK